MRLAFAFAVLVLACELASAAQDSMLVASPDGKIEVELSLTNAGEPRYRIARGGSVVLNESRLGLLRDDADFSRALVLKEVTASERVTDRYELLTAKRRLNTYTANRRTLHLATRTGD